MVAIVPRAFHILSLIVTSGPSDHCCTEIKIKNKMIVCAVFVAYFTLRRSKNYNALEW